MTPFNPGEDATLRFGERSFLNVEPSRDHLAACTDRDPATITDEELAEARGRWRKLRATFLDERRAWTRRPDATIVPASRTLGVRYAVRDVLLVAAEAKKAGRDMLYLNIGDPNPFDFQTPPHILEAVHRAMVDNKNGYAPSDGIPAAVDAIERRARSQGIEPLYTYVGSGASEVIDLALTALVGPGENVLTPSPGYPLYPAVLTKLGAEDRPYQLDEENEWQPDIDDIRSKIDPLTRAIVLINPNNPTGSICSRATLQAIVDLAIEHDLVIFSDEIYDRLLFDGAQHVSTASLSREATILTLNGMSKNYVVPGFRIGWGVLSGDAKRLRPFVEAIQRLTRARLSANHPEQYGIAPALDGPQDHIAHLVHELEARRDVTATMLNECPGISLVPPRGAFYAFPRLEVAEPDERWVADLIRATGVVVVHGSGFGQKQGTAHFRIVTLPPVDTLREAYHRIADFMAQRGH